MVRSPADSRTASSMKTNFAYFQCLFSSAYEIIICKVKFPNVGEKIALFWLILKIYF